MFGLAAIGAGLAVMGIPKDSFFHNKMAVKTAGYIPRGQKSSGPPSHCVRDMHIMGVLASV